MSGPGDGIDPRTRQAQAAASDPAASAWVSANAGSGKTFVLSRRVIRLLLAGAEPGKILCLTFTKAAAAEMAARVFGALARWTRLADAALAEELAELEGSRPDAARLAEARRLFARALETPGGLKIQTIHAFCERLLHQFPFEANVAGHFEVLDERGADGLLGEARRHVLARAGRDADGPLGRALRTVIAAVSDPAYEDALAELVEKRDRFRRWIVAAGSLEAALAGLRPALGLAPGDTAEGLRRRIVAEAGFAPEELRRLADLLAAGNTHDQESARRFLRCLEAAGEDGLIEAYQACFCKQDGELRAVSRVAGRRIADGWPGLGERIAAEGGRIGTLLELVRAADCHEGSAAMLTLADAVVEDYERGKRLRGVLDFEDLVVRAADLLKRSGAAAWVHYKLDGGIDHILVDEAQDTSPRQWQVVETLAGEFFAGAGARPGRRTLFAVGDVKQSIYSFQGAVPAWFARMEALFGGRAAEAGLPWRRLELHLSFRSVPDVLKAVDAVFAPPSAHAGLESEASAPVHEARRTGEPGRVTIWPMVEQPKRPEPKNWYDPLDQAGPGSPEIVLAERIAGTVAGWLRDGERLEASGRPIRPGGILILTRRRGPLSAAINRALKMRGLPIAGADRLALTDHIAVKDLMALGDVMLMPEDDLSLAAVLKGPLIGLDEDDLFALAHGRKGMLWQALEASGGLFAAGALARLREWRARADYERPFDFYARILGPEQGRLRFAGRLGAEAEELIDEFLAQALAHERLETPSLQGFLAFLRASATEITRDPELARDEIRVMTVHGAKGLEADVVFLVDDGSSPVHQSFLPRVAGLAADPDADAPAPLAWVRSARGAPQTVREALDTARRKGQEEYRRLLYVAATRARDRLIVCGTRKATGTDPAGGWHGLFEAALAPAAETVKAADGETVLALEWRAPGTRRPPAPAVTEEAEAAERRLPDWARRDAAPAPPERRLRPSAALEAEQAPAFPALNALDARLDPAIGAALARGRIVHRLLEALPEHPPAERMAAALGYLAAVAPGWAAAEREALAGEVAALLADPAFAPVFAPGSRAEVAIAGTVAARGGPAAVAGRIDRIAVTAERVLIVDYKTNRPAPARLEEVPRPYLAQLALYREVLAGLYPGREVAAALLWTDAPALMAVPAAALDAAAAAVGLAREDGGGSA